MYILGGRELFFPLKGFTRSLSCSRLHCWVSREKCLRPRFPRREISLRSVGNALPAPLDAPGSVSVNIGCKGRSRSETAPVQFIDLF